ncbi:MAG: transposase [Candidatus Scalindua sp.]|nr:transposase [Candidatus Scalindua sp.]
MDMWTAFANLSDKNISHADILYGKFHVRKYLGKTMDEI